MNKAAGRLALMLAVGLCLGLAEAPRALAAGADTASADSGGVTAGSASPPKSVARAPKRTAHHKPKKATAKPAEATNAAKTSAADAGNPAPTLPPAVTNAHAQLTSAYAPADDAPALPVKPDGIVLAASDKPAEAAPSAEPTVVDSDQLNDVDRTLQEQVEQEHAKAAQAASQQAQAQTVAMSTAAPAPASAESTSLDRTSLIGKIFIGVGAFLTMASAARMFMA